MRAVLFAAILVTGCQLFLVLENEPDERATPDARDGETLEATDGATPEAANEDASRCDRNAPFGDAVPLSLNTANGNEVSLWLTQDETRGYVARGSSFLHVMTQSDEILVAGAELDIDVVGDKGRPIEFRDTLYFHANPEGGELDIFAAILDGGAALTVFRLPPPIDAEGDDVDPWVTPRETLFFASKRDAAAYRIYGVNLPSGESPTLVAGLGAAGAAGDVSSPVVVDDELTIYFASSADGNFDIYRATRSSRSAPFEAPVPESRHINSAFAEYPRWASEDGCVMYFARGSPGTHDLYRVERPLR